MKLHKKKILFTLGLLSITLAVWFFPKNAFAFNWPWEEDTEEIVKFLKSHSDWLQYGSFFPYMLHALAWALIKGLYYITSTLEGLIPETLSLLDFLDDSGLQGMTKAIMNDLVLALMILTLVYLGFKTIIAKQPPNFKSVGVNIFISSFLLLGLPTLMDALQVVSTQFYDATQTSEDGENSGLSWNLIKENTADLVYVAENGFDLIENDAEGTEKNSLKPSIFKRVDMAQIITPEAIDDIQADDEEILDSLKYTLTTDESGEYQALEIDDGWLSFFSDNFDTGYFRFPAKFLPMFVGLTALGFAYFFTMFVFATTIIEIGIKRIVALFIFATDLESGQRTKQVVMDVCNAFMLIGFTGLMFRFYTLFLTFLGSSDVNIFIYLVAIIAGTFILIKGSNTIMKYFGIDVGLKDGWAQMAGAIGLAKTAGALTKIPLSGLTNKNKKGEGNTTKDKLTDEANSDGKSINESTGQKKPGGLKGSVNSAGKALGYMNTRGLSGVSEDALKGTGEAISGGIKGVKDSVYGGMASGTLQGFDNSAKWKAKKEGENNSQDQSENQDLGEQANQKLNKANTLQGKTEQNTGTSGTPSGNSVNNTFASNNGDSPTMNDSSGKGRTNEEILGAMKLQEAAIPTKKQEITANVKANLNGEIPSGSGKTISQHVTTSGPTNTSTRQSILQDIQHGSTGTSNDVKQKVVQGVQRAASVTPGQVSQKVVQDVQATSTKIAPINFSERLNNYESRKETKPSRFDFINKK